MPIIFHNLEYIAKSLKIETEVLNQLMFFSRTGFYLESSMAPMRMTVAGGLLTLGDETAF
jgi:hypothetical protein